MAFLKNIYRLAIALRSVVTHFNVVPMFIGLLCSNSDILYMRRWLTYRMSLFSVYMTEKLIEYTDDIQCMIDIGLLCSFCSYSRWWTTLRSHLATMSIRRGQTGSAGSCLSYHLQWYRWWLSLKPSRCASNTRHSNHRYDDGCTVQQHEYYRLDLHPYWNAAALLSPHKFLYRFAAYRCMVYRSTASSFWLIQLNTRKAN